jgi:DNA-binding CsgD family transcriptional regulator/tetratricopeptide (TPR) repeat protein
VVVHHARVAGDVDVLVEYGPRAAREAMAAESHREALEHLRSLEPYLERLPIPEQAALWMDRAQVEEVLARPEAVESITRAIDLYREAGADRGLARALTRAVRSYDDTAGDSGMAEACAGEAVALLDTGTPSVELAEALGQQAWLWVSPGRGRLGRAIEWADRAIEVAEEVGAERVIVDALISKGLALLYWFDDPAGYVALEESAERAAAVGYGYGEARALFNLACDALWNIDLDRAAELTRRAGEVAVRHEIEIVEARSRPIRAFIALYRGDWAAAEELVLEHAGTQTKAGVEDSALTLGAVLGRMGRPGGRDLLDLKWRAGVAVAETTGEIQALVPAAIFLAEWMWLTGDEDPELIERFLDALEPVYGHRIDDTFVLAFWLWELGHLPEIPDWFDEPVPPARAERRRPWRLVMTGHPREAAAIWEAKGCPYERALALMHGDDTDRIEALRIFDDLGAVTAAVRLRGILREEGVRVPRGPAVATRRHPAGLTSRQAEVLDLVAEGLTNSEIADRLFVSPRTVDNHVAAILTKLDAPDRDAAVDTARELELLGS